MVHINKLKESQEIVYNQHILISKNACQVSKKYIQWATELILTSIPEINEKANFHLVGPFNFESIDQYNQTRQKFHIDQWRSLTITPTLTNPAFDSNYSRKPKSLNK